MGKRSDRIHHLPPICVFRRFGDLVEVPPTNIHVDVPGSRVHIEKATLKREVFEELHLPVTVQGGGRCLGDESGRARRWTCDEMGRKGQVVGKPVPNVAWDIRRVKVKGRNEAKEGRLVISPGPNGHGHCPAHPLQFSRICHGVASKREQGLRGVNAWSSDFGGHAVHFTMMIHVVVRSLPKATTCREV